MIILKVHGNCRNYKFNQSRPAENGYCNLSYEKLDPTRYTCNNCGSRLSITGHNSSEIIYVCTGCGKIHKAKKGKILGRF